MLLIDKLCCRSKLRDTNAGQKAAYAVCTLCICLISRSFVVSAMVFLTNGFLTVIKGQIPLALYVRLLRIPAAFLLVGTGTIVVNISGTRLDCFAIPVGEWYVTAGSSSVVYGLRLCAVALSAVTCLYFLSLNTSVTDLLGVLEKIRIPALMTELMMLIYRFIFILFESASSVITAQKSRLGYRNFRSGIRSFGAMGSALFLHSVKRSGVLYDAMESRCYDGRIRVLRNIQPPDRKVTVEIILFDTALIVLAVFF